MEAEVVTGYKFRPSGKPKYPWGKWTNGKTYRVTQGVHFTCKPDSFTVYLYHRATKMGVQVKTSIEPGNPTRIVFRFVHPKQAQVKKPGKKLKRG